ncbi:Pdcd2 [Symbiodinium sp. CCMP2456]|nr:Pdcd2 [Symbiodinium sp. CCMP2456]
MQDPPSEVEKRLLRRQFFPSKVGGRPAWLIPANLPGEEELACLRCSSRMRFLMQIYASQGTRKESCFHRTLHIFVCTNCQPNEVRVFRAQLPRDCPYYSYDEPDREAAIHSEPLPDAELEALCCPHCGLASGKAPELCSDCDRRARNGDPPVPFAEFEISVSAANVSDDEEEEPATIETSAAERRAEEDGNNPDAYAEAVQETADAVQGIQVTDRDKKDTDALAKLKAYQEMVREDPEAALDKFGASFASEWVEEHSVKDPVFARFQRFHEENKSHVLRYHLQGVPRWFCRHRQLEGEAPICHCGGSRIFECQVQPMIISLLAGSPLQDRLDFGTICIYSCEESCDDPERSYVEEFAYVQPEPVSEWIPA